MTDTTLSCPDCGLMLAFIRQDIDAAGEARFLWVCPNTHYWAQDAVLGWVAIDPAEVPTEAVTIVLETE